MAKELHHWIFICFPPMATDSLSTSVRTPRKVNGQGSATRITLRGIGSFALFFSSSSRRDSAVLGSGSRHSLGGSDQRRLPSSSSPFAFFHEAEKRSRVPALILLLLSSVIPAPVEAPIDGMPARSSLSISWGLFNSRTRAKWRTRRAFFVALVIQLIELPSLRVYNAFRSCLLATARFSEVQIYCWYSYNLFFE